MAEVRGRRCDRPGCSTFLSDCGPNPPAGWVRVHIVTDQGGKDDQGQVEFCSDYCSAYWFLDRYELANGGKRLVRQTTKKRGLLDGTT